MALCCTHAAAGYLGYEAVRPAGAHRPGLLAAAVALANAADLDYVPGVLLGHPAAFHRGVTHTVLAAVLVAAAVALAVRLTGRQAWRRGGSWAGAIYGSHLVLDFFTSDVVPPHGARFLWPFSDAYYLSPVTPLPEIIIDPSGRAAFLASVIGPQTVSVWARELMALVIVVVAVHVVRAWHPRPALRDAPEEL